MRRKKPRHLIKHLLNGRVFGHIQIEEMLPLWVNDYLMIHSVFLQSLRHKKRLFKRHIIARNMNTISAIAWSFESSDESDFDCVVIKRSVYQELAADKP